MDGRRSGGWRERISDVSVEITLFLCSYAPLFVILAIRFRTDALIVTCALLATLGTVGGVAVLARFRSVTTSMWTVRTVQDRGDEVAGYLATYLLPFVTVTEPGWRDVVGYVLFMTIIGVIYVRSSLVQINPTFYLLGWRLFAVDIGEGWSGYVLARRRIARGQDVQAARMTERLFISYEKGASHGG